MSNLFYCKKVLLSHVKNINIIAKKIEDKAVFPKNAVFLKKFISSFADAEYLLKLLESLLFEFWEPFKKRLKYESIEPYYLLKHIKEIGIGLMQKTVDNYFDKALKFSNLLDSVLDSKKTCPVHQPLKIFVLEACLESMLSKMYKDIVTEYGMQILEVD